MGLTRKKTMKKRGNRIREGLGGCGYEKCSVRPEGEKPLKRRREKKAEAKSQRLQ